MKQPIQFSSDPCVECGHQRAAHWRIPDRFDCVFCDCEAFTEQRVAGKNFADRAVIYVQRKAVRS